MIITGGPGVGKTTLVNLILMILNYIQWVGREKLFERERGGDQLSACCWAHVALNEPILSPVFAH